MIKQRLTKLKAAMKENGIAIYIIPMNDFHGSEYIADYFKLIAYFSGFTGSAGTLVVTQQDCFLWTDGRYFLQAEQQLCGTGILLQKMGEKDVPTVAEYVTEYIKSCMEDDEAGVGFDGRLVSTSFVNKLNGLKIIQKDLAGEIRDQDTECKRAEFPKERVWILNEMYTGRSVSEKLALIRKDMSEKEAGCLILTTLDDIAWITNLRGNDIAYNPVFLSYMIITDEDAFLYRDISDIEEYRMICDYLDSFGITLLPYSDFYKDIPCAVNGRNVWIDETSASFSVTQAIGEQCIKITTANPVMLRKAVKNPVEAANIKNAHIKDGIAVTKLLYWLKTKVRTGEEKASELSVAQKLIELRKGQENYIGESFDPIVAFADHGAVVHYSADETTNKEITGDSFLLIDTGGHYLEGTTDITRTIAMGELTKEQKQHYTAVLQGNLRLADVVFKQGLCGANLDYVARQPLYSLGLDFNHGTGHGVGYLLNVHEGPNGFRMKQEKDGVFKEGMVTSNEPGVYLEGAYGIRLENLLVCEKAYETSYGQFLKFEPLTLVPFDMEAVDETMLTEEDKKLLDMYHQKVYEMIAGNLNEEECMWLAEQIKFKN